MERAPASRGSACHARVEPFAVGPSLKERVVLQRALAENHFHENYKI